MTDKSPHISVLLTEVLEALKASEPGVFIDTTFGAGGYTRAILKAHPKNKVYAFDRDESVLPFAEKLKDEFGDRFIFVQDVFSNIAQHVHEKVSGVVWDLGVSSMQIDTPERGFSFSKNGPLDMRMQQDTLLTAADIVNTYSESKIADILYTYGQEKASYRIARAIVKARQSHLITTTQELADIIHHVMPYPKQGGDSAMHSFQALRIFVNDELGHLQKSLKDALEILDSCGRLVVVSFHSLEDKIVKDFFALHSGRQTRPNRHELENYTYEQKVSLSKISKKPILPSSEELEYNSRSHSAKLRWAEKI